MYVDEKEFQVRKPMTFEECCVVFNAIQRARARQALLAKDRAKKSLTKTELLNRFAQMGGKVVFGKVVFTYDQDYGMGLLITPNQTILGATISDFISLVNKIKGAQ